MPVQSLPTFTLCHVAGVPVGPAGGMSPTIPDKGGCIRYAHRPVSANVPLRQHQRAMGERNLRPNGSEPGLASTAARRARI